MSAERTRFNNLLESEKIYKAFIDQKGIFEEVSIPIDINNPDNSFDMDSFAKKLEEYFAECEELLRRNNIEFKTIAVSTNIGFLCKERQSRWIF